jgi:hypothetical protein
VTSIFDKLEHEAETLGHGIAAGAEAAEHVITSHLPHHGYHEPSTSSPGGTMSVATDAKTFVDELGGRVKQFIADVETKLETDLPAVSTALGEAAQNPVTVALANAVHLPAAPSSMEALATLITKWDADLGQLQEAKAAAEAALNPPQPEPEPQPA